MSRRSTISGFDLIQLHDELRQEAAPFSEKYYSYVLDKDDIPNTCSKMICNTDPLFLSEQEILDGWVLVDHDKYVLKCKVWVSDTHDHDVSNPVGDFKRTFEVIADEGCHSYNLEMIPAYRKAIIGLEQGANNMEKDAAFSMIENLKIRRGSTTKETKNPSTGRSSKGEGKVSEDSSSSSSSSSGSDSSESSGSSGKSHIDNDDDRNISAVRKTKPETQHPVHNTANTFEQLCITYTNKLLHQQFNKLAFDLAQKDYNKEGIDWTTITYRDNQVEEERLRKFAEDEILRKAEVEKSLKAEIEEDLERKDEEDRLRKLDEETALIAERESTKDEDDDEKDTAAVITL
ncbi:unnamed protein product, partial [Sphagnum compactum]